MNNATEIVFVLDRSGSMNTIRNDVIHGMNAFIQDQRAVSEQCYVSMFQFDHDIDTIYQGTNLNETPLLNSETYVPRGNTRLLDAIGFAIKMTEARLSATPEGLRPRILFVIQTDGEENSSREYTLEQIKSLVTQKQNVDRWNFVFLGADIDAVKTGTGLGFMQCNSVTYDKGFYMNSNKVLSNKAKVFRSADTYEAATDALSYTDQDRSQVNKGNA
jgi:uncharacterized protein YegL